MSNTLFPSSQSLYGLTFTDRNYGWCVGGQNSGVDLVLSTTDGGLTWNNQSTGTGCLYDVFFRTRNLGWVVGVSGSILKTTNGGSTWMPQTSGATWQIFDVCFTTDQKGYAVGRFVLETTNGGTSWTESNVTNVSRYAISFSDSSTGYLVGQYGSIDKTTNGQTWTSLSSNFTLNEVKGVSFPDRSNGWITTSTGSIYHSSNGGNTWTQQHSGSAYPLEGITFSDSLHGWTNQLRTTNGGATWISSNISYQHHIAYVDNTTLFSVYNNSYMYGHDAYTYKSTDGGINWTQVAYSSSDNWYNIGYYNSTVWVVGDGLRRSTNSGSSWTTISTGITTSFYDITFVNATIGWIVGDGGVIRKTTNGGTSWTAQTSNTTNRIRAIAFANPLVGYAVCEGGKMLSTTNGGTTWTAQTVVGENLTDICFSDAHNGWLVGESGTLLTLQAMTVERPNGSETLRIGVIDTLRWHLANQAGTIRIQLDRNYPSTWEDIGVNLPNTGSYAWRVTGSSTSSNARIRMFVETDPADCDTSDTPFTIQLNPNLSVDRTSIQFTATHVHSTDSVRLAIANPNGLSIHYLSLTSSSNTRFSYRVLDNDSLTNAGDTLRIWVGFTPDSTITYNDTLRMTFDSPYNPITIPISGLGVGTYAYPSSSSLVFSTTIEPTFRDSLSIRIRIKGNSPMQNASWITIPSYMPFRMSQANVPSVNAGDSVSATVYFEPTTQGTFAAQVALLSNAINEDTVRISVSGTSRFVPAAPGNLQITSNNQDAILTWSRVDTSAGGVPLTVARYLIFFRSQPSYPWEFLWSTAGAAPTTFTHATVVTFSPSMYYQVRAWVGEGSAIDSYIAQRKGQNITETELLEYCRGVASVPVSIQSNNRH